MLTQADFVRAVAILHREKHRAYGNAWKKRGELLSILANIARKVDRIERLMEYDAATRDEGPMDTCVDLLVYSLKYQTYLADLDARVAAELFGEDVPPPYSEGTAGFDALLDRCDLSPLDRPQGAPVATAAASVGAAFNAVEQCIADDSAAGERQRCAADLATAAIALAGALRCAQPLPYTQFIAVWGDPSGVAGMMPGGGQ